MLHHPAKHLSFTSSWFSISEAGHIMTISSWQMAKLTISDLFTKPVISLVQPPGIRLCIFLSIFLALKHQSFKLFHIYIPFLVNGNIYFEFESGYLILDLYILFVTTMYQGSLWKVYPLYFFDLGICLFNLIFIFSSLFPVLTHILSS